MSKLTDKLKTIGRWAAIITFGLYLGYTYPNPSFFYSVDYIKVNGEVQAGQPISMDVQRSVNSDFTGYYYVNVLQKVSDTAQFASYCSGTGTVVYKTTAVLPPPGTEDGQLNLKWWIGLTARPDCTAGVINTPGTYKIESCWKIERSYTFPVWVCSDSNTFKVMRDI